MASNILEAATAQLPRWTSGGLKEHLEEAELDETRFRQIMAALGVRGETLDQPIEHLSMGQQKKIDLARTLVEPADVIIWDEPLNYIDIDTREKIETLLLRDLPTIIFTEHDAAFVKAVATKVIELKPP